MNCPKCNAPTNIIVSKKGINKSRRRTRKCKNCGYEFNTYEFLEENIRDYLSECLFERNGEKFTTNSLCWQCSNATGGCSWSIDFEPVPGWMAKKTKIRNQNGLIDSYEVYKCPLFKRDERW